MTATIDIACDCEPSQCPDESVCKSWIEKTLLFLNEDADCNLSLRFLEVEEMAALNEQYRGKAGATNVLSFPSAAPRELVQTIGFYPLGDIAICPAVLETEAREQGKPLAEHFAHIIVHGLLHLYGYDHEKSEQASAMETLEIEILKTLGIPNPYLVG